MSLLTAPQNGRVVHRPIFLIVAVLVVLVLISSGCTSRSSVVDQPAEVSAGAGDQSHELNLGARSQQAAIQIAPHPLHIE